MGCSSPAVLCCSESLCQGGWILCSQREQWGHMGSHTLSYFTLHDITWYGAGEESVTQSPTTPLRREDLLLEAASGSDRTWHHYHYHCHHHRDHLTSILSRSLSLSVSDLSLILIVDSYCHLSLLVCQCHNKLEGGFSLKMATLYTLKSLLHGSWHWRLVRVEQLRLWWFVAASVGDCWETQAEPSPTWAVSRHRLVQSLPGLEGVSWSLIHWDTGPCRHGGGVMNKKYGERKNVKTDVSVTRVKRF